MGKIFKSRVFLWALTLAWMGLIFYSSAQKGYGGHSPSTIYFLERKVFHVIEYAVLTVLLYWALRSDFSKVDSLRQALIFSLIFGFSDEWHQSTVYGRDGTLRDVGIDFLGTALMSLIIFNYPRWKKRWWK